MKSFVGLALLSSALLGAAKYTKEEYQSGVVHNSIMERKLASWARQREEGLYDQDKYPSLGYVECVDGFATAVPGDANQTFRCSGVDLYSFKSHADLGSFNASGSSSWGWTSEDGREFVAIGQGDGTAFAEISPAGELVYLGRLPQHSFISDWREIRLLGDYMLIGSEAVDHGIQIFDMNKLLTLDPASPVNFSTTADIVGRFTDLPRGRSHNVVVNTELGYAIAVGAQPRNDTCAAGLIYIDLTDPTNPTSPGCAGQDGYVHDAECLVYRGPDTRYTGRDICYGYNEDTLTIYDVTDKVGINTSTIISVTSYVGASYTHQGAVLDPQWQEYLILDDELDEEEYAGPAADRFPVTYIFDIRNLERPVQTGYYKHEHYSIDHNQYVFDGLAYQSNYGAGLTIFDVSSIPTDPTGGSVEMAAFFDIYPEDDGEPNGGVIDFLGTWSHYAGFKSGFIFVNTIERGGFVVKLKGVEKRGRGRHYKKPRNV